MIIETKLHCKDCDRFLATAMGSVYISELICARCKKRNAFNIITKGKNNNDTSVITKYILENKKLNDKILELESKLSNSNPEETEGLKAALKEAKEYAKALEGIIDGQG